MKFKFKGMVVATAIALSLSGCTIVTPDAGTATGCITVLVDFDILAKGSTPSESCIVDYKSYENKARALDVLAAANIAVVGTDKYPNEIVCRVNGLPSASEPIDIPDHAGYTEPCSNMPPEFAYWALLIKTPNGDWKWAPEGVGTLKLNPGDSLALVYSVNGNTKFPN